jgi:hypothetical protein
MPTSPPVRYVELDPIGPWPDRAGPDIPNHLVAKSLCIAAIRAARRTRNLAGAAALAGNSVAAAELRNIAVAWRESASTLNRLSQLFAEADV